MIIALTGVPSDVVGIAIGVAFFLLLLAILAAVERI